MGELIQFPPERWRHDYDELTRALIKHSRSNIGVTTDEMNKIAETYGYTPEDMQNEIRKILER